MPTQQDVRDAVRRAQSIGSERAMENAAEIEREGEKARLEELREANADTPEREGLEAAYPKRKPSSSSRSSSSRKKKG